MAVFNDRYMDSGYGVYGLRWSCLTGPVRWYCNREKNGNNWCDSTEIYQKRRLLLGKYIGFIWTGVIGVWNLNQNSIYKLDGRIPTKNIQWIAFANCSHWKLNKTNCFNGYGHNKFHRCFVEQSFLISFRNL